LNDEIIELKSRDELNQSFLFRLDKIKSARMLFSVTERMRISTKFVDVLAEEHEIEEIYRDLAR